MSNPISLPGGYAPAFAIGYADTGGTMVVVENGRPLPVLPVNPAAAEPLFGTATTSQVVGPLLPTPGRAVQLTLTGTWRGTVALQRSHDGGQTRQNVTIAGSTWGQFTANACEPVWIEEEQGTQLFLDVALASGSVTYRLAQ